MRKHIITLLMLASLLDAAVVHAAGSFLISGPDTLQRELSSTYQRSAVADGSGGMFVTWQARTLPAPCRLCPPPDTFHVWVQHVLANGAPAPGWSANGVRVTTLRTSETEPALAPDGAGGVLVAWRDERESSAPRIYTQRLDALGHAAPGWPVDGVRLSTQPDLGISPIMCSDGVGGAFVLWLTGTLRNLVAQHIDGSGAIVPGWTAGGRVLRQGPGTAQSYDMCDDGAGGILAAWEDTRAGSASDLYATRVTSAGSLAPGWAANGTAVSTDLGLQRTPSVCADGLGGLIVAWMDDRFDASDVFAQHLRADASIAPGWQAGGLPIGAADGGQWNPSAIADGEGGAIVAWLDQRTSAPAGMYATRVTSAGLVSPGWQPLGLSVSGASPLGGSVTLVPDGYRGAFLLWSAGAQIYGQHLLPSGMPAPGWPAGGGIVATSVATLASPRVCATADPTGSLFVVWGEDQDVLSPGSEVVGARIVNLANAGVPGGTISSGIRLAVATPAVGALHIRLSLRSSGAVQLTLVDLSGRAVRTQLIEVAAGESREVQLDAGGVAPGIYWVSARQGGRYAARRVVILN